jgi:hypothetical protein
MLERSDSQKTILVQSGAGALKSIRGVTLTFCEPAPTRQQENGTAERRRCPKLGREEVRNQT